MALAVGSSLVRPSPAATVPAPDEQRMLVHASWKEYVVLRELLDRFAQREDINQALREFELASGLRR